jgi:hypothetical protein
MSGISAWRILKPNPDMAFSSSFFTALAITSLRRKTASSWRGGCVGSGPPRARRARAPSSPRLTVSVGHVARTESKTQAVIWACGLVVE